MQYFKKLPMIGYDLTTNEDTKQLFAFSDMSARVNLMYDNPLLFDDYMIKEWDTPEKISFNLYGTSEYYWTILYINNIFDMYADWPLKGNELDNYAKTVFPGMSKSKLSGDTFEVELAPYGQNVTSLVINKTTETLVVTRPDKVLVGTYLPNSICESGNATIVSMTDLGSTISIIISEPTTSTHDNTTVHTLTEAIEDYLNIAYYRTITGVIKDEEEFNSNPQSFDPEEVVAVTKFDTLLDINEGKRMIKVVKPENISFFVNTFFTRFAV